MKAKIGIVGGAGPIAGALLLEKLIQIFQEKYGCHRDADFPTINLLSVPFSEMLQECNTKSLGEELQGAIKTLEKNGMELIAIVCNTLHSFLPMPATKQALFVDLRKVVKLALGDEPILVLCTNTSYQKNVFQELPRSSFLDADGRQQLDRLIERVLEGNLTTDVAHDLRALMQKGQKGGTILLGCTELSYLYHRYRRVFAGLSCIDPVELLAEKLCALSADET